MGGKSCLVLSLCLLIPGPAHVFWDFIDWTSYNSLAMTIQEMEQAEHIN